jgi:serine phosphatase RsbU (regulator of sigma subunit)
MTTESIPPERAIEWGLASRALPGETVSGDRHLVQSFPEGILAAVVDGLGHGQEAGTAARTAIDALASSPQESLISLVNRCHQALTKTRGATMTVASLNLSEQSLAWLGVGTVEGCLLRADPTHPTERMLLRGGVVGYQLPILQISVVPIYAGDLLVLASDGIRSGFEYGLSLRDPPQKIADRILAQHFKGTDDALVLAVRYLGSSA